MISRMKLFQTGRMDKIDYKKKIFVKDIVEIYIRMRIKYLSYKLP